MCEKRLLAYAQSRLTVLVSVIAVTAVYVLSRAPFLSLGYGLDDDAWLVARAADTLAAGGGYVASRLPGYPTVELLFGGLFSLFGTSTVLGNLAASAAGLAASLGIWFILDGEVETPLRLLAAVTVGFHPAIWKASVTTLDPIFGTAFLILAIVAVGRRRPLLGGLLLGLAVGCRVTNALAAFPIALFANRRIGGWRAAIRVVAAGAVVGGALFLLPAVTYGLGFLSYEPVIKRDFITGGYKVYRELVGLPLVLGSVATVAAVLASKPRRHRIRDLIGEPLVVLGGTAVVVLTTPFVLLPTDPQYLLPWVPFGVLFLAGLVRQRVLRLPWAAGLLVAAVVPSAIGFGQLDIDCWRYRRELRPVLVGPGQVTEHYVERIAQLDHASAAARFSYPIGSAVIVGRPFMATQLALGVPERELRVYLHQIPGRDVLLFRLIPPWLRDRVDDRPVFYATGEHLIYLTQRIFGYELVDLRAQPLQLWPSNDGGQEQAESR